MNPVLRESLGVFFGERQGLPVYFHLLIILAPVEFLSLYMPLLGAQMWTGPGNLLKFSSSFAVLLIVYFALRVANREYESSRFKPLKHWLRDSGQPAGVVASGQVAFLVVHIVCSLLLSAPLLIWAAAIARAPLAGLAETLALIPFYALCYGVWGLVALVLWEREPERREMVVRLFIGIVALASMAIYLPLNPVAYLLAVLGREELAPLNIAGVEWSADSVHFGFHLVLGGAGLAAHRWALERGR
jgi:hypothetical protein